MDPHPHSVKWGLIKLMLTWQPVVGRWVGGMQTKEIDAEELMTFYEVTHATMFKVYGIV